jgi:hypothetical protein
MGEPVFDVCSVADRDAPAQRHYAGMRRILRFEVVLG